MYWPRNTLEREATHSNNIAKQAEQIKQPFRVHLLVVHSVHHLDKDNAVETLR